VQTVTTTTYTCSLANCKNNTWVAKKRTTRIYLQMYMLSHRGVAGGGGLLVRPPASTAQGAAKWTF